MSIKSCTIYRWCGGYVLLTVVVMLAVCALMLYQISLASFHRIESVMTQEQNLRRHWTNISLRRSLLPQSARLFEKKRRAAESPQHVQTVAGELSLNNMFVSFTIADESAKINLVHLWHERPKPEVIEMIRMLAGQPTIQFNQKLLRHEEIALPWIWSDVLDTASTNSLISNKVDRYLTLWGNGRINIMTTSDEVLQQAWQRLFGHSPPDELKLARSHSGSADWESTLPQLGLRSSQMAVAQRWFSDRSECFSLRLELKNGLRQSVATTVFVLDPTTGPIGYEP
jgi:hypothetical protein